MKRILTIVATAMTIISCSYDDSDLKNQLSNTKQDIADLNERLEDLEDWQKTVNSQIQSLQTIAEKVEEGKVIADVQESTDGVILKFSDDSQITVKHGTNGKDGTNGTTPAIGIKDKDGVYYWTLDGNWLLDDSNNMIKAHGADGITPRLDIIDGEWSVSYDNGNNWEGLGVYVDTSGEESGNSGISGNCIFRSVTPSETEVVFVFQDGNSFSVPIVAKSANLLLNFSENTFRVAPGYSESIDFNVTGAEGEITVEYVISDSWKAEMDMTSETSGTFTVKAPAPFTEGKLVVFATDESGKITMKTIYLQEGEDPSLIFKDDFSWATGPALLHSTSGEKRFDLFVSDQKVPWETTVYTGVGSEEAPTPAAWTRDGYLRMNAAKKPSNLVTPKLTKIEGTVNLEVTFRACQYQSTKEPDGYHEIHISCLGAGRADTETFTINNLNNTSNDEPSWNTLEESVYTFSVTGATADTQIEFHFGPRREASAYNTNMSEIPEGWNNANCRMGFDDVTIKIAE